MGRLISSTEADGGVTLNRYDLDGNLIQSTNGMGNITRHAYDALRHKTATVDAIGARLNWTVDNWGVIHGQDNLGNAPSRPYGQGTASNNIVGFSATFRYDAAGRKIQQGSSAKQNIEYGYTDGLLTRIDDKATGLLTTYSYDLAGNRLTERQTYAPGQGPAGTRQNNTLIYDMQNRVTDIDDDTYTLHYDYDANGNRTGVRTQYDEATPTGPVRRTYDTYNAYDKMNRQTVVNGDKDASGTVVYGKAGHAITYDYAGNRLKDTSIGKGIVLSGKYLVRENVATTEDYVYDAVGRLADVRRDGIVINSRRYDLAGRVAETGLMTRSTADGLAAAVDALGGSSETHIYAYNWIGQIISQQDNSYVKDRATGNNVRNIWFGEGYDPVGNLRDYTVSPIKGDNTVYTITYEFTNGYRETGNRHNRSSTNNVSGYDVNGNRTTVTDTGTGNVVRQMVFDADGHVQSRFDFVDGKAVERFSLIVNGQVLGEEDKKSTTVLGSTYAGVTASSQVAPPAFYSVQGANESLQSIAQSIWGDSKLWYLIADANGIDGATKLAPGDQLRIPTRVNTVHNDYATFRPYDAAEALGNNAPAMPPPSQGGGCGAVGTLIMIVVAVVVTIYTAGALSGATANLFAAGIGALTGAGGFTVGALATAAVAGAAGSIASQVVGNAIGAQDGFSWRNVALSAIGSAASAGVGAYANGLSNTAWLGTTTNGGTLTYAQIAARAAVSSTVSQGVGMVAGVQSGFSWRNVAVSYASAYVGAAVAQPLSVPGGAFASVFGNATELAARTVSGFAAGATASILRGGKIDVARIATDAFGNALGSSLAENMGGTPKAKDPLDGIDMQALVKNGNLTASLGGPGSSMRPWSGDGEIMADFDPSSRIYANEYEYQNRENESGLLATPNLSADDLAMQRVVITGKRLDPQAQEDWYKYQMRASMPGFGRAAPAREARVPSAVVRLNQQWDLAKNRLVDASHQAGVDPGTVTKIAAFESRFDPSARPIARNAAANRVRQFDGVMAISSAYGYGQFTDASWTDTINRYGEKYGVDNAGRLNNAGAAAYRTDTDLQAEMLAEFTKANVAKGRALGGSSDDANVYALHNLGSGDGPRFLRALANDPSVEVRDVLSRAVIRGNPSLYGDGSITLQDAYGKMGNAMANGDRFAEEARLLLRAKYGH